MTRLGRVAATWRALGPRGFAAYAARRASAPVPGLALYAYRLIAVPRAGMPVMPAGFSSVEVDAATLSGHAAEFELDAATIAHRMGQGMTCLGAVRGGRLRGISFLTAEPFAEDEADIRFVPPPGGTWDTGLFVRAPDRAGRTFAALWAATAQWLAGRGLDWSFSRINLDSQASLAAHARMGAVTLRDMAVLKVPGKQWLWNARPEMRLEVPGAKR